ncbi:hypothetical protein H483_0106480 [Dietzia sp. UCD-THP]|uniref:hypothetical protein n=1 Tax=Dietzia sp. UCD-THP TaxID=1292020 RepID=UPI00037F1BE7|nr:hypothetical protein [Dietzia sp. UCD-THP]EYT63923.1 hypothetical protein H483_0106480 [Dietzia sp. UCD-THP]
MTTTLRTHLARATAVAAASATVLALTGGPAHSQTGESGGSLDSSLALLDTSTQLQGGEGNLGNIAGLLGSLSGVAEGDLNAMQMVDAMSSALDSGAFAVLAGLPGGLNDFAQTCMRAIAGQATIEDVWRQFNAIGAPLQYCNDLSESGGFGGVYRRVELGRPGPTVFRLRYETYSIPDTITVLYEGRRIFIDPEASTRGNRWVDIDVPPGASTAVQVEVIAPIQGTDWNFTVHCP